MFKWLNFVDLKKICNKVVSKIFLDKIGNQFYWNPPYDYVQNITVNNVHKYLDVPRDSLKDWCIVGVHLGKEIKSILNNYPNVNIIGFECSKRYIKRLKKISPSIRELKLLIWLLAQQMEQQIFLKLIKRQWKFVRGGYFI